MMTESSHKDGKRAGWISSNTFSLKRKPVLKETGYKKKISFLENFRMEEKKKMKNKTKIMALLEVVVLCSVVSSGPVFAAEQNAKASPAATAAAGAGDDFVLGI